MINGILLVLILGLTVGSLFIRERDRDGILRSLLVGAGSILVFVAAIFSLGFIGYTIPFCAVVGAYLLPFVIPVSLGLAVGAVFTKTAAALSCDCGDVCVSTSGWRNNPTDAIIEIAKVTETKEEQP